MSETATASITQAGVVGIGVGVGGFLLVVAVFFGVKLYRKRREYSRAVAEIEGGFGRASIRQVETSEISARRKIFSRGVITACNSAAEWNALSSSDQVHRLPKFAPPAHIHPAFISEEDGVRASLVIASKRSRLNRISSRDRRIQGLSAIIESPRSYLGRSSVPPAAFTHVEPPSRAESDVISEGVHIAGNGQDLSPDRRGSASPSIQVRASAAMRLSTLANLDIVVVKDINQPKAIRSKSIGPFLGPLPDHLFSDETSSFKRPALHSRSVSFGAQVVGPAPTGPLPPLPSRATLLGQRNSRVIQGNLTNESSRSDSPECNWERIVDLDLRSREERTRKLEETRQQLENSTFQARIEQKVQKLRPLSSSALRNSAHCSTKSAASKRTTVSSIRSSLDEDLNRLSIPTIETAERLSVARVSSCNSLRSETSLRMVSTPTKRRIAGSRVSVNGSPAERRKALRAVSGNVITPQRPISAMERTLSNSSTIPFNLTRPTLSGKPSAMKGSPGSRKGHRRQNCVRISTLAPTVLGPSRSRSSSPFSMDEIVEEGETAPYAHRHMNGDITLRPRLPYSNPTKLRASLTSTSPALSMAVYEQEQDKAHSAQRWSRQPNLPVSRDSSLFSIPSFPSPTQEAATCIHGTPAIAFTRPSCEWSQDQETLSSSPPFALHVTPGPASPLYSPDYAAQTEAHHPKWPMLGAVFDPPSSGQEYDPARELVLYSSPESSSSVNSPFAVGDVNCSDPIVAPLSLRGKNTLQKQHVYVKPLRPGVKDSTISAPCPPNPTRVHLSSSPPVLAPPPWFSPTGSQNAREAHLIPAPPRSRTQVATTTPTAPTDHPRRDSDKENAFTTMLLASAASLPSPLDAAPTLKPKKTPIHHFAPVSPPHALRTAPPPPTRPSTAETKTDQTPPLPRKNSSRRNITTRGPTVSGIQKSGTVTKPTATQPGGPRPAPARDLRRNIRELRRKNSEMAIPQTNCVGGDQGLDCDCHDDDESDNDDDEVARTRNRYLRLGRENSPLLPFIRFAHPRTVYEVGRVWEIDAEEADLRLGDLDEGGVVVFADDCCGHAETRPEIGTVGFEFGFDVRPLSVDESDIGGGVVGFGAEKGGDGMDEGDFDSECKDEEERNDDPPASILVEKGTSGYSSPSCTNSDEEDDVVNTVQTPINEGEYRDCDNDGEEQQYGYMAYSPLQHGDAFGKEKRHLTPIREASLEPNSVCKPHAIPPDMSAREMSRPWTDAGEFPHKRPLSSSLTAYTTASTAFAATGANAEPVSSPSRLDMLRSPRAAYEPTTWKSCKGEPGNRKQSRGSNGEGRTRRNREGEKRQLVDDVDVATPRSLRSLYDEGGFLKSSPLRGVGV